MKLWVSHRSDIPIPEQLATQIILSILGGDLVPGQQLPSMRALARRLQLHPNTVAKAYQQLERESWVESRQGSGTYVRSNKPSQNAREPAIVLEHSIAALFQSAKELKVPLTELRERLYRWLDVQPPDHFLVIEPDPELRQIVIHEMQQVVKMPVRGCDLDECQRLDVVRHAIPVALPSKVITVQQSLPPGYAVTELQVRSAPASLAEYLPAPSDALVAIASRWDAFRVLARTMLVAAGFQPDSLIFRDAKETGWQEGLAQTSAVVCDSLTALQITGRRRVVCFSILSHACLESLNLAQPGIYLAASMSEESADGALPEVSQRS